MKILIATGIYPPKIGGPAQYSQNIKKSLENKGNKVKVATFGIENYLPTGFRHLWFLLKVIPKVFWSDLVICMDTFSVGLPSSIMCKILGKKCIIRTGGDFLWEQYVERTGKKVLLSNFYQTEKNNFSMKDKIIFSLTRWTLNNVTKVVFSTEWQRDIFISAYGLEKSGTKVIENYYGRKEGDFEPKSKVFVASARNLTLKNFDILKKVFSKIKINRPEVELFIEELPFPDFMEKLKTSYAVVQVSLGDISPNLILDAIRFNRPFICTKEVGILARIREAGLFINPLDESEIESAVLSLLDKEEYNKAKEKVRNFSFIHGWDEIALEYLSL